jgi:hypothetical protein
MERKLTEHYESNCDIANVMYFLVTAELHDIQLSGIKATDVLISTCKLLNLNVNKVRRILTEHIPP